MLVRRDGLVVGQPAHAWVSGQLARAWGNEAFPAPAPREPFCLAAEQHDVGWADADLAPVAGPAGRPIGFMQQPRPAHLAIWRGAARRLLAQSRYAALLVSLHGTSLYERVDAEGEPPAVAAAIRDYVAGERALQSRLAAGLDPTEVDGNRRLLLALDRLSLMLCHGNATTLADVPAAAGAAAALRLEPVGDAAAAASGAAADSSGSPAADSSGCPAANSSGSPAAHSSGSPAAHSSGSPAAHSSGSATADSSATAASGRSSRDDRAVPPDTATARFVLDPWPFAADAVFVGCEARRLDGSFAGDDELRAALEAAPWVPLRWELSPG